MDQDTKRLCCPDLQEWERPPQLPSSARSVDVFPVAPVWLNRVFSRDFFDPFSLKMFVFMVTCRSWAWAMWRWTPAVPAARTVWRTLLQNQLTTPALKTSTKVIFFASPIYLFYISDETVGGFSAFPHSAHVVVYKKFLRHLAIVTIWQGFNKLYLGSRENAMLSLCVCVS